MVFDGAAVSLVCDIAPSIGHSSPVKDQVNAVSWIQSSEISALEAFRGINGRV